MVETIRIGERMIEDTLNCFTSSIPESFSPGCVVERCDADPVDANRNEKKLTCYERAKTSTTVRETRRIPIATWRPWTNDSTWDLDTVQLEHTHPLLGKKFGGMTVNDGRGAGHCTSLRHVFLQATYIKVALLNALNN